VGHPGPLFRARKNAQELQSLRENSARERGGTMCRPFGTRLVGVILPGTAVPGYRLFRPCGTASFCGNYPGLTASLFQIFCGNTEVVP
jgi:hypothetical protein